MKNSTARTSSLLFLILTIAITGCTKTGSDAAPTSGSSDLGHGYARVGDSIRFQGKRIDEEGADDIVEFSAILRRPVKLASNVDAESFEALSDQYSKDTGMVYYKWISGPSFWVVEVPDADPATFEVLGFNIARDRNHVWLEDVKFTKADSATAKSINGHRVWLDAKNVYNLRRVVPGADPATFEAYQDGYHYRDENRVYRIFNTFRVIDGADPKTFTP